MFRTKITEDSPLEAAYPIRVWAYALRDDSGGAGRHRGGDGIRREYELTAPGVVTLNCERREIAPYGSAGGADGAMGVNTVIRAGEAERVPAKWTGRLEAGDRLVIETPGGGGWGGPIC